MPPQEDTILAIAGALSATTARYAADEISAAEFVQELTGYMSDDVVFWSNYTPSWEPLRPLFAERRGIDEIVARYDYENEHEVIEHESGVPFDFAIAIDTLYYTQLETASFFDKPPVTWDMVTKIGFVDDRIATIRMFLDPAPIEKVYGAVV
jgi:hypothetical protein